MWHRCPWTAARPAESIFAMQTRRLGDQDIPPLGIGTWAIGGPIERFGKRIGWGEVDDAVSLCALRTALDAGIRLIDSSDAYGAGRSERLIGEAIAGRRDEVILATKFGHSFDEASGSLGEDRWEPDFIRAACEGSLRRLGVECIDLYQFHISAAVEAGGEVRQVLEELVQAGKIRWFGWSTDRVASFEQFADSPHCVAVQQHLNVAWDEWSNRDLLHLAERAGCASLVRGPLGHGLLTGKYHAEARPPADDFRHDWNLVDGEQAETLARLEAVRDILQSDGRSLVQGALAWVWGLSPVTIPIPGFKNQDQITGLVGALEHGPLTLEQMHTIDRILGRQVVEVGSGEDDLTA